MSQAVRSTTVSGAHHRSFCNGRPAASRRIVAVRCDAVAASKQVETRQLGKSGLTVPVMGVGAWSWGDRSGYWSRTGANWGYEESKEAYQALMDAGINFIDTAEVYGFGKSEEFIGDFIRQRGGPAPIIATKYAPQPWRQTSGSVVSACKASLKRLGQQKMGLYIQHWPGFLLNAWSNDGILEGLAECYNSGLTEAVGVSNFTAKRVNNAAKVLQERGTCLSSNQVQYSLLYRRPETNGVMEACKENGVTMVAYSPMCQGLLTGKYTPDGPKPKGPRGAVYSSKIKEIESLISGMRAIGEPRGKTPAQVALNWVICQGALPIPGAKNARQVQEVAGALGWRLDEGEMAELDKLSSRVKPATGAPFESW